MGLKVKDPNGVWRNTGGGNVAQDGISPVVSVTEMDDGHRVTIADAEGENTFIVADGKDGKDGKDGADGTSVTITDITESNEDGGSNVVTFSDGNTLTVKNGSKGADGEGGGGSDLDILGSEITETDIIPQKEVALSYNASLGAFMTSEYNTFLLTAGEEYQILWGDQTFTCTAFEGIYGGEFPCVALGNPIGVGGADNGLPFIIGTIFASVDTNLCVICALEQASSKVVRVYQIEEADKLKMEYIPNALYSEIDNRIENYINEALGGDY